MILGGGWNQYDGDHFGEIIWAQYASNMNKDYEWYRNNGLKSDLNFYAKANYQVHHKINIYGDLQYRMINYKIKGTHDDLRDISQEHNFHFINKTALGKYRYTKIAKYLISRQRIEALKQRLRNMPYFKSEEA